MYGNTATKYRSNQDLVNELKSLSDQEHTIVNRSIELLREVEDRRIYLKLGYSSLYEFCISELKYSEGSSYRRIGAMRLLRAVPEIKEKVASGKLSLTAMAQAQSYFRRKEKDLTPIDKVAKLSLLEKLEHRSSRECEREILKLDPKAHRPDRVIAKTEELTEIRLTVDNDFMKTLDRLKDLLSNKLPEGSTKDVMLHALKAEVARLEKPIARKRIRAKKKPDSPAKMKSRPVRKRISLPESIRREIHIKNDFECCFRDPRTLHKCKSKRYLEIDHILPVSHGGTNDPSNLQLLCSAHNKLKSNHIPINLLSSEFKRKPTRPPKP